MNEHPLDPALQSLEARLAGQAPRSQPHQQHELLYECGFAAGANNVTKSLRRWQAAAASLLILAAGLTFPLAQNRLQVAEKPVVAPPETHPLIAIAEPTTALRPRIEQVALDAWQLHDSPHSIHAADATLSPLAVGSMTRSLVGP